MGSAEVAAAGAVREEDSFDVAAVEAWLSEHAPDIAAALGSPPEVRQFAGGASNLTYLLRYPQRELILRRPPPGRQPTHRPGMLRRAEVVDHYAQRTGHPIERWEFYEVFGLFRLAVIVQQIYRRYHLRQSRNPAFRHYWLAVHYLDRRCRRVIGSSS